MEKEVCSWYRPPRLTTQTSSHGVHCPINADETWPRAPPFTRLVVRVGNRTLSWTVTCTFFLNSRIRRKQISFRVYVFLSSSSSSSSSSSLIHILPLEYYWSLLRSNQVVARTQHLGRLRAKCPSTEYPHSSPSPIYQSRGSGDLPRPAAATDALVLIPCRSHGIPPRAKLGTLSPWVHSKSQSGRGFVSQDAPLPQLGAVTNH